MDFRFCQRCGYRRKIVFEDGVGATKIDLDQIDQRLQQLLNFDQATSYAKQKLPLQKELEAFLAALPGRVTLATVPHAIFVVFLSLKILMVKPRYTLIVVNLLAKRETSM